MEPDVKTVRDPCGTVPVHDVAATDVIPENALRLSGEKRSLVLALFGIIAVAGVGVIDGLTGYEFGFSPFYLIPITIVSFYGGSSSGIATAVSATGAWYLADAFSGHPYSNSLAIYWNAGVRLLIFVSISLMLARLKSNILAEKMQREKLAELIRLKNQFVGIAAHDLRTPLAVIWMCAESLRKRLADPPDQRQAEALEVILEKSDFMLKMVANLLDLSAIESGSLSLQKSYGNYGGFVRRHLVILQNLAERNNITLQFEGNVLPAVSFDRGRIEQVLDNLIMNAVKFSPPHSIVTVAVSREGEQVVTRVVDRGPGISPNELPQVFTAFKQAGAKPAGGEKGAGLGLAIAKKIVEAHGGEIAVATVPGKETTFLFTLPVHCG